MNKHYTQEETETIRAMFAGKRSDEEIAAALGRTATGITIKRRQLGLHRPDAVAIAKKKAHKWTADELEFIKSYWNKKTDEWMARKLGVTIPTYKKKRQRMTVVTIDGKRRLVKEWTHRKGRRLTWTFAHEEFLREHYPTHSAADIGRYLGRKENTIQTKARRMGLKKAHNPGKKGFPPIEQYYDKATFKPKTIQ